VADDAEKAPGPFDVATIRHLVRLMSRHDLGEIDLSLGDARIRLRRGMAGPILTAAPAVAAHAAAAPQTAGPAPPPVAPAKKLHEIRSPSVGTFYNREKPESEPYVRAGAKVTPGTVVGLIEAMKLFNEIQAECSGTVVEVLVENGHPVDFNTVLYRVDPSA
jgi:acetyl-CoA carboxylase biotin carboxyl carrier protein